MKESVCLTGIHSRGSRVERSKSKKVRSQTRQGEVRNGSEERGVLGSIWAVSGRYRVINLRYLGDDARRGTPRVIGDDLRDRSQWEG